MYTSEDQPNLAGFRVGITTLSDVRRRLGTPEKVSHTPPCTLAGGDAGGDLIWDFPGRGIRVVVAQEHAAKDDPTIEEVAVREPFESVVLGGVWIGQGIDSAKQFITDHFKIKDVYEDSIYFGLIDNCDLRLCVENWGTDKVVCVELMQA